MIKFSKEIFVDVYDTNISDENLLNILKITNKSSEKIESFDNFVLARDYAILEHLSITLFIKAPVYVFRTLMSERYLSYYPNPGIKRIFSGEFYLHEDLYRRESTRRIYEESYSEYLHLLQDGISPDLARTILPINTYSDMMVTLNMRELLSFLDFIMLNKSEELNKIKKDILEIIKQDCPMFYKKFLE